MYTPYEDSVANVKVELNEALFIEVPGESPVGYRPISMSMDNVNFHHLLDCTNNGLNINSAALRDVARGILKPSRTSQGEIFIENGWNFQRFAFFLEFTITTPNVNITEIITGYTSHTGFTDAQGRNSGYWDPEMQLFINNHMRVKTTVTAGAYGNQTSYQASDVSQVLRPIHVQQGGNLISPYESAAVSLRPKDALQALVLTTLPGGGEGVVCESFDMNRPNYDNNKIGVASSRRNELSSNYLSRILTGYSQARGNNDHVGTERWAYSTAASYASEKELSGSILFAKMAEQTSYGHTQVLTFGELERWQPHLFHVLQPPVLIPPHGQMTHDGEVNGWGAPNEVTAIAHALSHTVPAAMSECMLAQMNFVATNRTLTGEIDVCPTYGVPIFNSLDQGRLYESFRMVMQNDILPEIFPMGMEFEIEIEASLFGFSKIRVSLHGNPHFEEYTAPNYADGLTSTNIGMDNAQVLSLGEQTGRLLETVFASNQDPGVITDNSYPY